MAGGVTRGLTFQATETVTNTKLHSLVDDATLSNVDQDDMDATSSVVTTSASALSTPQTGEVRYDTSTSPNIVRAYDGTNEVPVTEIDVVLLTNKSGGALAVGDVVVLDTTADDSFTTTTTAGDDKVLGVLLDAPADDALGLVAVGGRVVTLKVADATSRGDYLKTSTTAGKATSVSSRAKGVFARALSTTAGDGTVSALLLGVDTLSDGAGTVPVVGTFASPAGTGNQSITGVGFQPSSVMVFSGNTDASDSMLSLAVYDGTTDSGFSMGVDVAAGNNSGGGGEAVRLIRGDNTEVYRAQFVSLDSDGFTINWITTKTGLTPSWIAFP